MGGVAESDGGPGVQDPLMKLQQFFSDVRGRPKDKTCLLSVETEHLPLLAQGKGFWENRKPGDQASEDSFAHKAVSLPQTSWSRKKLGPLSLAKGSMLITIP
jgi:hypothetical protein